MNPNKTGRAQRARVPSAWLDLSHLRLALSAYALCALLFSSCPASEYIFFPGEDYQLRFETYTIGEQPHVVCTEFGIPPNLYGEPGELFEFIETQAPTHELTIETVALEISQELTVQWITHGQVMKWWAQSETVTIATDRWTVLDLSIAPRQSQFLKAGQGSYFDVARSWRDVELLVGDVNLSDTVDDQDLSILLTNWPTGQRWSTGDLDGDHRVGDEDLSLLLANWTHIPEPSILPILCLALLRRKRWCRLCVGR